MPSFAEYGLNPDGFAMHPILTDATRPSDRAIDGVDVQRFTDALTAGSTASNDTCPGDFDNSNVVDLPDLPDLVDTLLAQ